MTTEGESMERPITIEEAAALLGGVVTVKTLYRWAAEGRVPSIKLGGRRCFMRSALLAWVAAQGTGGVR